MKISTRIFLTNIISEKQTFIDKLINQSVFKKHDKKTVFARLRNAGVHGVELLVPANVTAEDIRRAKSILKKNKMQVFSIHQPLRIITYSSIDEVKMLFKIARLFSAKVIVLHLVSAGGQIFNREYIRLLHSLEDKEKITIGFENSQKHMAILIKKHVWDGKRFSSLMDNTNFHITLDTTHLAQTGTDIIRFFLKNKERIINIHLSDYKKYIFDASLNPFQGLHLPLGKGQLPVREFLKTLKDSNYKGIITFEINGDLDEICKNASLVRSYVLPES